MSVNRTVLLILSKIASQEFGRVGGVKVWLRRKSGGVKVWVRGRTGSIKTQVVSRVVFDEARSIRVRESRIGKLVDVAHCYSVRCIC